MKKIKELYKRMNKNVVKVLGIIMVIVILSTILIIAINNSKNKTLTCSKVDKPLTGFVINETVKFELSKEKIKKVNLDKEIQLSGKYAKYETFKNAVKNHFDSAYNYVPEKNKEITTEKNNTKISLELTKGGIVLNNFNVTLNNKENPYDVHFETYNNLDTGKNVYKINQKITKDKLKKKIEGLGYTCK